MNRIIPAKAGIHGVDFYRLAPPTFPPLSKVLHFAPAFLKAYKEALFYQPEFYSSVRYTLR